MRGCARLEHYKLGLGGLGLGESPLNPQLEAGGNETGSPHASEPALISPAEVPATSSIMAAVAGLGAAEKNWKERLQSDEFRKPISCFPYTPKPFYLISFCLTGVTEGS